MTRSASAAALPPKAQGAVAATVPDRSIWRSPWVQLKYFSFHPCIYPAMIKAVSPDAKPGALVQVYTKSGEPFGAGLFNPRARVPLRIIHHGADPADEQVFPRLIDQALDLRLDLLRLADQTDAFRAIHSDGDALSGLIVDRYADVLSVEVHSLGIHQRLPSWLPHLHQRLGTRHAIIEVDPLIARIEGIPRAAALSEPVRPVRIRENGIRFEVNFDDGHKTGFFCDQRDNRRRFGQLAAGRRVLDLCCYTGGFALAARIQGQAADVTGVDLDETAIRQARRNANLNQTRVDWVHCDAFSYARQMQRNGGKWDAIVLDPPKLISSREDFEEGLRKYEDLNQLAAYLSAPNALLVSCSCSGKLEAEDFEQLVIRAVHRAGRRLQILDRTGAAPDHPVLSNCPESRYLKVLWSRVL
jgi:23S rRNA (cytosine1962-C5)-methyltransferase